MGMLSWNRLFVWEERSAGISVYGETSVRALVRKIWTATHVNRAGSCIMYLKTETIISFSGQASCEDGSQDACLFHSFFYGQRAFIRKSKDFFTIL